jgi:DNA-binding HxlR family transcriptional regulator
MAHSSRQTHHGTTGETPAGKQVDAAADCPAGRAMELVAHKWTIHILFALHEAGGPARFRRLQRTVAPITQKELTKRLRDLERSGLVHRRVYAEVPPRVEYRLTKLGLTLMPALTGLHEWAERHGAAIDEHWRRGTASRAEPRAND